MPLRIGINGLAVSPERPGGDVTYVLELARGLPMLAPDSDWVIFGTPWCRSLFGELSANVRYVECSVPSRSLVARALYEQTALVRLAERQQFDVLFAPVNVLPLAYRGRTVLTLHEAEPFMPAIRMPAALRAWWRVMRSLSARRAERVLTVSDAARNDLVQWMGLTPESVQVVHLGVDLMRFSPRFMPRGSRADQPYLLWVGRPYPRKNLSTLLDAFAELRQRGRRERLALVGPRGWEDSALQRRISADFPPSTVCRYPAEWQKLPEWYRGAQAFVFPSTHETFGLPVLEAMASGTPVIAGDVPSLREIGADAALYAAPLSAGDLASAIESVLVDSRLQATMRDKGLRRAEAFSWARTSAETLRHLRAAAARAQ